MADTTMQAPADRAELVADLGTAVSGRFWPDEPEPVVVEFRRPEPTPVSLPSPWGPGDLTA